MAKEERFEKVYSQGFIEVMEIWVDKETGVNYLYHAAGNGGGLNRCWTVTANLWFLQYTDKQKRRFLIKPSFIYFFQNIIICGM